MGVIVKYTATWRQGPGRHNIFDRPDHAGMNLEGTELNFQWYQNSPIPGA